MIAKVEPLTPARSLRGPFDYRLAGALEDVGVGSMLVVPFGRRRLLGVVVDVAEESELPPERLAEPIAALEADVPQSLVRARAVGGAGVRARRPRAGSRWCCRRARAPAPAAAAPEALAAGRDHRRPGEAALPRARGWARASAAALEALAGAPLGAAALARRTGCTHATLRSLERRGLMRLENAAERAAPAARRRGGGARRGSRRAHGGPGGGVRR